LVNIQIKKLEY